MRQATTTFVLETDKGSFRLIGIMEARRSKYDRTGAIWILACLDWDPKLCSGAWFKVMKGKSACYLSRALVKANQTMIAEVIAEQLGVRNVKLKELRVLGTLPRHEPKNMRGWIQDGSESDLAKMLDWNTLYSRYYYL